MSISILNQGNESNLSSKQIGPATQDWVHQLPIMQQSVLLSGIRGCDGIPKHHKSKALVKWYRRCVLVSAFDRRILSTPCEEGGGSFTGPIKQIPSDLSLELREEFEHKMLQQATDDFIDSRDELPAHYQLHMMHAFEVVGFKHPTSWIREFWAEVYQRMAKAYHLWPETNEQMNLRLGDNVDGWLARCDPSTSCSD